MIYILIGDRMSGKTEFLKNMNMTRLNQEDIERLHFCDKLIGAKNIAIDEYDGTNLFVNGFIKNINEGINIFIYRKCKTSIYIETNEINLFLVTRPCYWENVIPQDIKNMCKPIYFKNEDIKGA